MATTSPSPDAASSMSPIAQPDPHQWSAARIAGAYLVAGILWIGLSDLTLAATGWLTEIDFRVSASQGILFVLLSSGFVFWLSRREYLNTTRSMTLLRAVVEGTSDAVFVKDPKGRYLLINSAGAKFIGKPVSETLGRDDRELFTPLDGERLMANDREIMIRGKIVTLDETLTSAGITRTYQATKAPYYDVDGKLAGIIGISRDITDRTQVEAALRETEARLREAQRIAKLGSWSWEPPTNRVWWSDAEFDLFGIDVSEVRPSFEAFVALLHPDDRKIAVARVQAMPAGADEFADDLRILRKDGTCIWIHSRARATRDDAGNIVRVEGTDQDITDRKRSESDREASERRLRLVLEAAGAIAFVWDIPNDTVTRYFSKEPALPATDNQAGNLEEVQQKVHPEDLQAFNANIKTCLAEGTEYFNEYRVVRPDGTIAYLEEFGFIDRSENGSPVRLTGMSIDITERVAATESLRASEERLRVALKGAQGGVWDWSIPDDLSWWSPEMYELMGAEYGMKLCSSEVFALIDKEDRERVQAAVTDAITYGSDYHCEFRVKGGKRWLSSHARLSYDANGKPYRMLGISWDITDRIGAIEALRLSESRYRQLVDMLPTAIMVHVDNVIRFVNPAMLRLMGAEKEEILMGRSPSQLLDPSSDELLRSRQQELAQTRQPLSGCEMLGLRIDGRTIPLHVVAAPIEGYGANATLVAISDLTERERSAALLRSVLDSVDDAILTVDNSGTVSSINRSTQRLFGYTEDELLGTEVDHLFRAVQREHPRHSESSNLRLSATEAGGISREVKGRRKDGTEFPAELVVTEFLRDGQREFTWVIRDITARRQLEEQFRQAQKMEAVGRLAGGVAHDFNNLLTVINGYSELMLSSISMDDPRQGPLAAILDAGERAAKVTKQLLALSRKSMVEPKLVDLNDLVTSSASLFRRLIGEDITLLVLTAPVPVRVVLDPGHLEQVLMNLVVNARDAMPSGGQLTVETRNVTIEAGSDRPTPELKPGRYALLRVVDTGCGISEAVKDKIFEPFFTTKSVGKGTGLGLAVVLGVVQQSGGAIAVDSTEGVGTTFKIFLPSAVESASEVDSTDAAVSLKGRETILVVEDEEAVRTIVKFTLQGQGYTVLTASSGLEALELIRTQAMKVDLLVTDMIMPGISGRELAEKAKEASPSLRIIFMSGYTDDALSRYGMEGTSEQFIQKPFTPLGLVRKIRSLLDKPT